MQQLRNFFTQVLHLATNVNFKRAQLVCQSSLPLQGVEEECCHHHYWSHVASHSWLEASSRRSQPQLSYRASICQRVLFPKSSRLLSTLACFDWRFTQNPAIDMRWSQSYKIEPSQLLWTIILQVGVPWHFLEDHLCQNKKSHHQSHLCGPALQ